MNTKNNSNNKKKKVKETGNLFYDFVKISGSIPAIIWMRPKKIYYGNKNIPDGGFMISANHTSFFDPIVVLCTFWKRRIYSLATKDLYKTKLHTWFFDHVHCIQVDKENFSLNSFHEVTRQLKRDKVLSIFPEGQVNLESSEMLAFKSGVILMAYSAKVPILPVYFVPVEHWYQRRVAVIGEPIDIKELVGRMPTEEELNRAGDFVHQKQQELRDFYYNKISKKQNNNATDIKSEVTK